jgi:hypothetical protein
MFGEGPVTVNGNTYIISRTAVSAKTSSVSIRGRTITIKVSSYLPREEVVRTFIELRGKVIKDLEKHPDLGQPPPEVEFFNGQALELQGKPFKISIHEDKGSKISKGDYVNGEVVIRLAEGLGGNKKKTHASNLCRRVISHILSPEVILRVKELDSENYDFGINKVFIKDTITRWGSCNQKKKNINLNFRLLFAPTWVMDYVIIHELAHIKEGNHSKAYWSLVESAFPNYKEARKWLKLNGDKLGAAQPAVDTSS